MVRHFLTPLESFHRTLTFCVAATGLLMGPVTSDILVVLALSVLITLLENTLKTDVCPPFPQLFSLKMPKPS